ncbi:hypothetical protein D3C80_1496460 [compost metagenome]
MTSGHFIAFGNLTFLGNIYPNELIYTWRQFITVLTSEYLNINDNTVSTVRHTQRGIANFTCLFTKDLMQQAFFSRKLSYTFRCYFTYENITGTDFSTDADNTTLVKIAKRFFPNVRNITCNFFRSKLCITRFGFVFLNMNRGIYIFFNELFTKQDRILVVIAFPSHEGNDYVASESQFSHFSRRPVR